MTEQCPSCGGFCKKGCERENVQPEQEPVAWMYVNKDGECEQIEYGVPYNDPSVTPLYTAPPQREWQGLTDEEMMMIYGQSHEGKKYSLGRAIEAKLKEKNT